MDILKPELQYIDGICYRINPGISYSFDKGTPLPYEYEPEYSCLQEPECEETYNIEVMQNGRYKTSFHIARLFFPYIIGTRGATKKRLETETKTVITVPKQGCEGDIVITGLDKKSVSSAKSRIDLLVISARKKLKATHFLSIPLTAPKFQEGFTKFKKVVLENCPGIDEALFQAVDCLHITLGLLILCDDFERQEAAEALQLCKEQIISSMLKKPLKLKMVGLEYMNDDPSSVNILYAKITSVDEVDLLQNLVNAIVAFFTSKGLIKKERGDLENSLIHVTLMNSKFFKPREEQMDENYQDSRKFDGTKIFNMYSDFCFGEDLATQLDLSIMHCTKPGYWPHTATVPLS